MKPYVKLSESKMSDGTVFSLHKHDGKFYLKYNGLELMSTALTLSEELLADVGCVDLLEGKASRPDHPRILIGGLGLGFTLKRTLELVGRPATVEVATNHTSLQLLLSDSRQQGRTRDDHVIARASAA